MGFVLPQDVLTYLLDVTEVEVLSEIPDGVNTVDYASGVDAALNKLRTVAKHYYAKKK